MSDLVRKNRFSIFVLLAVILLSAPNLFAKTTAEEFSKWKCKLCPEYTGWYGDLVFGMGYATDDSLRFGDYRGQQESGVYLALGGKLHYRNQDGLYFDMYARDLGLQSRKLEMRGGRQGGYQLRFAWSEIPKYRGYGAQTPFLGVGGNELALPADWQPSFDTGGMTTLDSSLANVQLKTLRKTLDLGLSVNISRSLEYKVDFQQQKKKGTRAFGGGSFFSNSTILPAPVDFATNQFDMSLGWTGKRSYLRLGFIGSWFDNGKNSITWQNPFTASINNQYFRSALEPSNDFYQFNLSGNLSISPRVNLSSQVAIGRLQQNDPFLPYSINPAYSDMPLPRTNLGGSLDTSTFNFSGKLIARLSNKLSFTARARLNDRDNKTPVDLYTPVTTDLFPAAARYNRPYSYKRGLYSADLRYRPHRIVRLSGGAKLESLERTLQAISDSDELSWWGELKLNPLAEVQFRVKLETAKRDVSKYIQPDDGGPAEHPLMRKFNQADRERDRLRVELDLTPLQGLGINLSFFQAEADYTESLIGLQNSTDQSYSINLSYALGSRLSFYAFVSRDDIDARITGAVSTLADPWNGNTSDSISTTGLGLSTAMSESSSLGIDFVSSVSKGNIVVRTSLQEDPFEPLRTNLQNIRFHFTHQFSENWGYKLYAEHEAYDSQDWALDELGVDGINSILTMGVESPKYRAWYFRIQANYRF